MRKGNLLALLILIGLVAGVLVGEFVLFDPAPTDPAQHDATLSLWQSLGDIILMRPLKMIVIPLIFISVVVGITSLGDPARLGLVGSATVVYYLSTMLIAVVIGVTLVSRIEPGVGLDQGFRDEKVAQFETHAKSETIQTAERELGSAWMGLVRQIIPSNPLRAAVEGRVLSIITFAILLGLGISAAGPRGDPAKRVFDSLFRAMMAMIHWILWLTPPGVFFLTAWSVGNLGLGEMAGPVGLYMLTVVIGLAIHAFVILPLVLAIFGRCNPYRFMWKMRRALMTAFGTDSSSATLPVTLEVAEEEAGCSKKAANFVLPLGATVNMDGTALYEAVAVVFLFQAFGIQLAFPELLIVVITATLAAVGAAGIPSAGLVTMVIVITAVNTALGDPTKELPLAAIGIILGVDRILDMCRTTVNVWGDATGAKIITRLAPDEPVVARKQPKAAA
ncbi:MAG: dicarboxylate/amino acid:cation symporter [Phycisphaerales bacterium]|nr:dicarboxylate/amino acid:cation symporter [Phycisphaerales bacterium]